MSIFTDSPYPGEQTTTPGTGPGPYGSPTGGYTGGMFPSNPSLSGLGGMNMGGGVTPVGGRPIQAAGSGGWTPENPTYDPNKPVTPYQPPVPTVGPGVGGIGKK